MALDNVKAHTASRRQFLLVVDSNEASLSSTAAMLDRFQYRICEAKTAQEALEIASIMTPALIILAQKLEDMSGLELLKKLKQERSTSQVPLIVLTSKKDPAQERACLSAGAVVCLPAPCHIEDLYRVVQMTIEPVPRMNMRIPADVPVTISNRAGASIGCRASFLSEQGLYIATPRPYPLRTKFPLQITLAGAVLGVEGEVIYSTGSGREQQPGMGVQFVQISQQDQMLIRKFIRDELARGVSVEKM